MKIVDRLLASDHWSGRFGHPVEAIVIHITDGNSAEGAIAWWSRPDVDASAHWVVDRDGTVYRVVDEANAAWANGIVNRPDASNPVIAGWLAGGINPNLRSISVEIVGRPGRAIPAAQWQAVVELVAGICRRHGIPANRERLIGHYQIDSVNRARCPGFSSEQWQALIGDIRKTLGGHENVVGDGIRRAMARHGDEPASDERYLKDEHGDVISIAAGRSALYFWHPATDLVYRLPVA